MVATMNFLLGEKLVYFEKNAYEKLKKNILKNNRKKSYKKSFKKTKKQ
jgi:hypothetical protein